MAKETGATRRIVYRTKQGPTSEQFDAYQRLYAYFNAALFDGKLPPVILNFSRRPKSMGFFAPKRWERNAQRIHEISLNPSYLKSQTPIQVGATLVHEMVHLWQEEFGAPSRTGYHNGEWADKMEAVGLMPSDTGAPGGRRVGQHMADYVLDGGRFALTFAQMPSDHSLPWQCVPERDEKRDGRGPRRRLEGGEARDSEAEHDGDSPAGAAKNKVKYSCEDCHVNVWGKSGLVVICGLCGQTFCEVA